jgi:hypothetical protein
MLFLYLKNVVPVSKNVVPVSDDVPELVSETITPLEVS